MNAHPEHRAPRSTGDGELMTMPENHLDQVVSTGSVNESRRASTRTRVIAVVMMPLFFIITFSLCYLSALHAPAPHDFQLTMAGPASVTKQIAAKVDDRAEGAFEITRTTSTAAATQDVANRDAAGAILIDDDGNVTTVIASGGGRTAVGAVQDLGTQVADELGGTVTTKDVAPTTSGDPGGSVLFFLLVACTVGAFMTITVVAQAMPRATTRAAAGVAAIAAVLVPVIAFGMLSIFVGDYDRTFGEIAAVLGVGMLYTFTVGLLSIVLNTFLRNAAIFGQILFLVALNFPSSGGSSPVSMLPTFWQGVHNSWFGAGGYEAMRSIIYFDGANAGRWILQLGIWAVAAVVLTVLAGRVARKRRSSTPDGVESGTATAAAGAGF